MGMSEVSVWVLIRRYDKMESENDILQTNLQCFSVLSGLTLDELKRSVYQWANVEIDDTKVIKIRRFDSNLIPLSTLLRGSRKEKPFIIDVVNVHQFCPVEKRTIPPGYVDALQSKLYNLEKRVILAETLIPDMATSHIQALEATVNQLINCVSFLDRRLDELVPHHLKAQIESTT
ncbi:uncharacterized protein [Prorops nasuta]|uniref:uncharacterized protein n=1 Tax=Prorops nasuta TaxID=863751 RepID=UPI0034CE2E36